MKIRWYGYSFFQIKTKLKDRKVGKIVINPFGKETGLKPPRKLEADIVLLSTQNPEYSNVKAVSGKPFLIEGPGEYEIKEIFIGGIASLPSPQQDKEQKKNTIYIVENEDIRICHLGHLNQKELTDKQIEKIGEVDILMVPIGGKDTVSAEEAAKIVSEIEPKITIPMYYALPKLKIKLQPIDKFLKIFGIKSVSPTDELSIAKKGLPKDEAKIIVLKI